MSINTSFSCKKAIKWIFYLVSAFCVSNNSLAVSHLGGGEINYTWLGGETYRFTLYLYQQCNGIPDNIPNFQISDGVNTVTFSDTFCCAGYYPVMPSGQCNRCTNASCAFPYGIQFRMFNSTVDLTNYKFSKCQLTISFSYCCYNFAITTGGAGENIYVNALLNRCNGDHSSPVFNQTAVLLLNNGKTADYYQSATPANINDSIVYKLIPPLSGANSQIPYSNGYAYNYPLVYYGSSPTDAKPAGFHYDAQSGEVFFIPEKQDVSIIAFETDEYAKDKTGKWYLAGNTTRANEIISVVLSNTKNNPQIGGIAGYNSDTVYTCAGVPLTLQIKSFDRGNTKDTITLTNTNETGGSFSYSSGAQPTGTFNWTPANADVRLKPYRITLTATDDATPIGDMIQKQFYIVVKDSMPNVSISNIDSGCGKYSFKANVNGTKGLSYKWFADGKVIPGQDTTVYQFPFNGAHIIRLQVSNAMGCTWNFYDTLKITILPNITTSGGQMICVGGDANLTAKGGLKYNWFPATGLNSDTGTNVAASPAVTTRYFVSGTDSKGCKAIDSVQISVDTIHIGLNTDTTICFGSNAHISANAGNAATYNWVNNLKQQISDSAAMYFKLVSDTTYHLTVKDNSGCSRTVSGVVHADHIKANAGKPVSVCYGYYAYLQASGGDFYDWKPTRGLYRGSSSSLAYVNPPQNNEFVVTVSDSNGCSSTDSVLVIVSAPPSLYTHETIICKGDSTQLFAYAARGKSYSWINARNISDTVIPDPYVKPDTTTTYTVIICDTLCGCNTKADFLVTVYLQVNISAGVNQDICSGQTALIGTNAPPGLSYSWSSSPKGYTSTMDENTVRPSATTVYYLQAKNDITGCQSMDSVTVTINSVDADFTGIQNVCQGDTDIYQAKAYSKNQTYSWNTNGCRVLAASKNYVIVAWDSSGSKSIGLNVSLPGKCNDTKNLSVHVSSYPHPDIVTTSKICLGSSTSFIDSGDVGNSFTWSFGDKDSSFILNPAHIYALPGSYHIILQVSNNLCKAMDSSEVQVFALPHRIPAVSHTGFRQYLLDNNDSNGIIYTWDAGDGNILNNSRITHAYHDTGIYKVEFQYGYSWGCSQTFDTVIHVTDLPIQPAKQYPDTVYIAPNPFTDHFVVDFSQSKTENIQIVLYDALGKLLSEKAFDNQSPGAYHVSFYLTPAQQRDGVYLLKYMAGEKMVVFKIIKI